ncbi:hypothetical protein QUA82_34195 [Microcoleus sp. F8-D3]
MVQHARQDETRQLASAPRLWLWWTLAATIAGAIVGALEESGFQFIKIEHENPVTLVRG